MNSTTISRIIHEKDNNKHIKQKFSTLMKINSPKGEYSLNQNFFDPTQSSPPNEFLLKLKMRMSIYEQPSCECIKDVSRSKE